MNTTELAMRAHDALGALGTVSGVTFLFIVIAAWSLAWKGVALWYAARNHQKRWFVALLILNTIGILEIVYLLGFRRDKQKGVTPSLFNNPVKPEESEEEVAEKPTT